MQQKDLERIYKQWKTGLLCCMPTSLRRIINPQAAPYVLEAEGDDAFGVSRVFDGDHTRLGSISINHPGSSGQTLKSLKGAGKSLILRLPSSWVLKKRARFPAAAEGNLRQVIGFEMDRLTPFPASQVYYDYQITERTAENGELVVDLAILPRNRLEPLLLRLKKIGLQVTCIDVHGCWEEMNLLPADERPGFSRLGVASTVSLWLLLIVMLVAVLGTPLWQKRKIVIDLEVRASKAKQQAMVVTGLRNKVDQELELLNVVPKRRNQLPATVDVIRDLTNLLPDDTWVQQLELKNGNLELRGMSRQATSLIQTLENSPGFHNVGFRSPVLQAQGEERFHLSTDLLSGKLPADDLMISGE